MSGPTSTEGPDVDLGSPLIYGFGAVGEAIAQALATRGVAAPRVDRRRPSAGGQSTSRRVWPNDRAALRG